MEETNKVLEVFSVLLLVKSRVLKSAALIEDLLGLRTGDLTTLTLIDLHSILDIQAQVDVGEIRILHASLGDFLFWIKRVLGSFISVKDMLMPTWHES